MDESGGDDDASAKVASEEIDVEGDAESGDSFGDDGKECCASGNGHDNEEGGNSCTELAIVLVGRGGEGADYVAGVCSCEIDVGSVEVCVAEIVGRHIVMIQRVDRFRLL